MSFIFARLPGFSYYLQEFQPNIKYYFALPVFRYSLTPVKQYRILSLLKETPVLPATLFSVRSGYRGTLVRLWRGHRGGSDRFIPRNPLETPSEPPRWSLDDPSMIPRWSLDDPSEVRTKYGVSQTHQKGWISKNRAYPTLKLKWKPGTLCWWGSKNERMNSGC